MTETGMHRRAMLEHHLAHNHHPPVSADFIETAEAAIEALNAGDAARLITLPTSVQKYAYEIAEELHLDDFIEGEPDA